MTSSGQPAVPLPPAYPMKRVCPVDPPPEYARFRDEQPLARIRLWDGSEAWLATRYQDVRQILFDPRFSIMPSRSGFPFVSASRASMLKGEKHNFAFMDPPEHTGFRRKLTGMFTVKKIAEMGPAIERIVKDLIDAMEASGPPMDLVPAFALPLPSLVIADLLGVPYEDHHVFQECARQRVDLTVAPEVSLAAGDRIFDYLDGLLRRIEADPGDGSTLLSRLAIEQILPGHLAHEDAVGMARVLLLAGHDTTATQIGAGMLALLQNPRQWQELIADDALIPGAVEEMLRYATIAHHNAPRVASEDVEIGGQTIRAGEGVIASLPAANRDPAAFPDPDRFDINRKAHHHVAFAFGPHQCLGQALARLELQIAFRGLVKRLPSLRLAVSPDELRFKHDSMTFGVLALPVEW